MTEARVIEAMLLRWGENHASGRTVTFQLPEDTAEHPFKGLPCGPANGQRMALSIALISDDETVQPVKAKPADPIREPEPEPKPKTECSKPLARQAGMLCKDNLFKLFLNDNGHDTATDELTAQSVRDICHVTSRSEIDGSPEARREWIKLRGEFEAWKLPEVAA